MGEETPLERLFRSMGKDGDGTVTKKVMLYKLRHHNESDQQKQLY